MTTQAVAIPPDTAIGSLLIATLIGLLIGLDRERKRERASPLVAGVRTFTLIALLAGTSALLVPAFGVVPVVAAFLASAGFMAIGYHTLARESRLGATTEIAALVTFALGALAGLGAHVPALAGAVLVTGVLSLREELHHFAGTMTSRDLQAVVRFAVVSLVILPLVPDTPMGPWDVWNPRSIWFMVVLISGVSFLGYVAMHLVGTRRGIGLSSVLGGLTSSTAVTLAFARRARAHPALRSSLVTGVLAASAVAGPRLLVLIGVVAPGFVLPASVPVLAMTVLLGLAAWHGSRRDASTPPEGGLDVRNPLALRSAFTFALAFAAVLWVVRAAEMLLGDRGVLLASLLAGLTDLDAITLSLAEQRAGGMATLLAVRALAVAAAANCVVKGVAAWTIAGAPLGRRVTPWLVTAGAAALASAWWLTPFALRVSVGSFAGP